MRINETKNHTENPAIFCERIKEKHSVRESDG